jgi:outer membrane protein assembly factor BamB
MSDPVALSRSLYRNASSPLWRLSMVLWVGVMACMVSTGCETAPPPKAVSKSFRAEPFATQPRLDVTWRHPVDVFDIGELESRQFAPPALHRSADRWEVFVGTDSGEVLRYRGSDGTLKWRRRVDGPVHASAAVTKQRVFVGTLHGMLYAIDRTSGEVDWKASFDRGIESAPAAAGSKVFAATNRDQLVALDASSGERLWSYERETPEEFTVKGSGTPVVQGETVYCGFADGTLAALSVGSGEVRWTSNLSEGEAEFADVDAPVTIEGDRIYALSYGVGMFALDRKTGRPVWRTPLENAAAYTLRDGTLYVAIATGRVIALDADDGKGEWSFDMETYQPVDLSIAGPYVFVSTGEGPLYVLDRESGYPFSTWNPSNGFSTPVVFSSRFGYLLSNRGYLYSFRVAY